MAAKAAARRGTVRIIGGRWRGRKLPVPPLDGLRPTPDRVRETLFNWLAPHIRDAHCMDLYAGTGALGLEALSRGAASCLFVDASRQASAQINSNLKTLNCNSAQSFVGNTINLLSAGIGSHQPSDIVFVDPPFGQQLLGITCALLEEGHWLRSGACIYLENGCNEVEVSLPELWQAHRDKTSGDVRYRLFVRS